MKRAAVLFLLVCCSVPEAKAKSAGATGADFLSFDTGARPAAMAGACAAIADDANSIFYNPGGIGRMDRNELFMAYNEMGEGIRHGASAYAFPSAKLKGVLAAGLSYMSVSGIEGYSPGGYKMGEVKANDLALNLDYGRPLGKYFSGGLGLKWIREQLDDRSQSTIASDAGILCTFFRDTRLGLSIMNMGPALNSNTPLPTAFKTGVSHKFSFWGHSVNLCADGHTPVSGSSRFSAGVEWSVQNLIALRTGYQTGDDLSEGFRYGAGVKTKNMSFDYAFTPRGAFQSSHRVSVSIRYGGTMEYSLVEDDINRNFKKAVSLYNRGEYLGAYKKMSDILQASPGHKQAREYLARISLILEEAEMRREVMGMLEKGNQLLRGNNLLGAKEQFESVLLLDPKNADAEAGLAQIKEQYDAVMTSIFDSGVLKYNEGDFKAAGKEMERVLVLLPEHKGAIEYTKLIREKEEKLSKIAIAQEIGSYIQTGIRLYEKGEWAQALLKFNTILEIDGRNEQALDYAARTKKKLAEVYFTDGMELYKIGKLELALSKFKAALSLDKESPEARAQFSTIKGELDRINRKKAAETNDSALGEYGKGNLRKAIELWERALSIDPDFKEAQTNLERARKELE